MRRRDADPDRTVTDGELADAVLAARGRHREPLECLAEDLRALFLCYAHVRLVLESEDSGAVVVITDPTFERDTRARGVGLERALELDGIDRTRCDLEAHPPNAKAQPPATGGKNSTSSPADSRTSHAASSSLIATLQRVIESAKPCLRASSA